MEKQKKRQIGKENYTNQESEKTEEPMQNLKEKRNLQKKGKLRRTKGNQRKSNKSIRKC
jgi:hypothetical protein